MRQFTCPKAVTHPSTNRARCRATALIETNALPLHQTAKGQRRKSERCAADCRHASQSVNFQPAIYWNLTTVVCWSRHPRGSHRLKCQPQTTEDSNQYMFGCHFNFPTVCSNITKVAKQDTIPSVSRCCRVGSGSGE